MTKKRTVSRTDKEDEKQKKDSDNSKTNRRKDGHKQRGLKMVFMLKFKQSWHCSSMMDFSCDSFPCEGEFFFLFSGWILWYFLGYLLWKHGSSQVTFAFAYHQFSFPPTCQNQNSILKPNEEGPRKRRKLDRGNSCYSKFMLRSAGKMSHKGAQVESGKREVERGSFFLWL